jgi:hypothetical protein
MPGFIGGSGTSSGGGTSGEIRFPKEFIDPVTKLRISQPENLIDTDFEYGLQPTKWETVELINNTPSFFSKSGDTTIPSITSITTTAGTREITVTCALEHGVSVGIPIQVTGTKSITADGSFIIGSVPNPTSFTYLCKAVQPTSASIDDLYSSIITGEFFQGSQLRISDAAGIVTDDESISTLTVKTETAHGFKANTPFYFLNLNSTISQEFQASNTSAKSFDSTNSATAQTFDGSNTLSSINVDWSNSAVVGGATSTITAVSTVNNTITVSHNTENFAGQVLGTPVYYAVTGGAGYFATNPRGVIFLKSVGSLGTTTSTFQVSASPDGTIIPITASLTGTFQLANQARTFAGNNVNPATQTTLTLEQGAAFEFDGGNQGYPGTLVTNGVSTVLGFTVDNILVQTTAGAGLDYYVGAMVRYSTTGSAATGLVNNTTYFVGAFSAGAGDLYNVRLKNLPTDAGFLAPSGGTGTQTFTKIGVSLDKDIVHIKNSSFTKNDMLEYTFPESGNFVADVVKKFYYVEIAYDAHNYKLYSEVFIPTVATGGTILPQVYDGGRLWNVHQFSNVGTSTFSVTSLGTSSLAEYLIVAGGGGGGNSFPNTTSGGGGGGGGLLSGSINLAAINYSIVVGGGGAGGNRPSLVGGNSSAFGLTAIGGGGGGSWQPGGSGSDASSGGSGGGGSDSSGAFNGGTGTAGQGFAGGNGQPYAGNVQYGSGGGGGAGGAGSTPGTGSSVGADGGIGRVFSITGNSVVYAAGGGGGGNTAGQAGSGATGRGGNFIQSGFNGENQTGGGGGGGGSCDVGGVGASGGSGGSGIVVIRYPATSEASGEYIIATGGATSVTNISGTTYAIHSFRGVGTSTFNVSSLGVLPGVNQVDYLIVGGGGSGGSYVGGGGGGGGVISGSLTLSATGSYPIVTGVGGPSVGSTTNSLNIQGRNGGNSSALGFTAIGGGGGGRYAGIQGSSGGSGGGTGGFQDVTVAGGGNTAGQGFAGGGVTGGRPRSFTGGGGGGGGGGVGQTSSNALNTGGNGGVGATSSITGTTLYWAGGGGGGNYTDGARPGNGGLGGGGGGSSNSANTSGAGGGTALNTGGSGSPNGDPNNFGGNGGANTGGGGGGNGHHGQSGIGGSGIVIIRYRIGVVS